MDISSPMPTPGQFWVVAIGTEIAASEHDEDADCALVNRLQLDSQ
jgi:hypothetical protein